MGNEQSLEKTWNTMFDNWEEAMNPSNERKVPYPASATTHAPARCGTWFAEGFPTRSAK